MYVCMYVFMYVFFSSFYLSIVYPNKYQEIKKKMKTFFLNSSVEQPELNLQTDLV